MLLVAVDKVGSPVGLPVWLQRQQFLNLLSPDPRRARWSQYPGGSTPCCTGHVILCTPGSGSCATVAHDPVPNMHSRIHHPFARGSAALPRSSDADELRAWAEFGTLLNLHHGPEAVRVEHMNAVASFAPARRRSLQGHLRTARPVSAKKEPIQPSESFVTVREGKPRIGRIVDLETPAASPSPISVPKAPARQPEHPMCPSVRVAATDQYAVHGALTFL